MSEVNLRKTYHNKLVGYLNQIKAHATSPLEYTAIITVRARSRETMEKCENVQAVLIGGATDDSAIVIQESAFAPIEATFQEIENAIAQALLTVPAPGSSSGGSGSSSSRGSGGINVKLPAIELPTFNGNYADWVSFKDLFLATVDSNTQLSKGHKLQYLKSALQGEPATLIKAMSITDANYNESWNLLNERYDNKREIVCSLISKFLNHKHCSSECAQELQALLDCVSESVRALKVLSCPTDKWDDLLVVILVSKLDPATRREWAIRQTGTNMPTFDEFSKFLSSHIRGLLATGVSSNNNKQKSKQIRVHHTSSEPSQCLICTSGNHFHHKCPMLLSKSPRERSLIVQEQRLCFNCLSKDHPIKRCNSKTSCRKCNRRHHTLLHFHESSGSRSTTPAPPEAPARDQADIPPSQPSVSFNHINTASTALLKTAIVNVPDKYGSLQTCRIFIDGGSQGDFISEACVHRLQLHRQRSSVTVRGFANATAGRSKGLVHVTLVSRVNTEKSLIVDAHVLPKLTSLLPSRQCKVEPWPHIRGIRLADPEWFSPAEVDIVIGIQHYAHIMGTERLVGSFNAPVAYDSIFGWILAGQTPIDTSIPEVGSFHVTVDPDLDFMRRFWEIEEPPKVRILTEEEKACEEHYIKTHYRDDTGRFHVRVPFNGKEEKLGYSKEAAIKRLYQVERRLQRQPQYREQYNLFMKEYIEMGHMCIIPPEEATEKPGKTFYMPHHFVVNESSSTTKLRVVFDGSAKSSSGVSVNDAMLVGATIQDDLFDQLLRFRAYPIVLKADIAKMFRQFRLHPQDQDYHRIVWRNSITEPIRDYRLQTVTYGTACATFLATRCVGCRAEVPCCLRSP